jgi:hypothetical protein
MLQARKVTVIKIERGDLSSISAGGAI